MTSAMRMRRQDERGGNLREGGVRVLYGPTEADPEPRGAGAPLSATLPLSGRTLASSQQRG